MENEKVKLINPNWYSTLEFLVGMLDENKATELIEEMSKKHFEIEDERDSNELDLVYRIAYELDLPSKKLPSLLLDQLHNLDPHYAKEYSWYLSGKAQAFIFRNLSSEEKEKVSWEIIFNIHRSKDIIPGFKFDLEGAKLVLNYLTKYGYPDIYQFHISPKDLTTYLKPNKEISDLWLNYLNSNKPNKDYIAEVLIGLGEGSKVIKPLLEQLKEVTPKSMLDLDQETEDHIRNTLIVLASIGESALSLWEEILKSPKSKDRTYVIEVLKILRHKSHQKADSLLRESLSKKEYVLRCIFREDWRADLEDYWSGFDENESEEAYTKIYDNCIKWKNVK